MFKKVLLLSGFLCLCLSVEAMETGSTFMTLFGNTFSKLKNGFSGMIPTEGARVFFDGFGDDEDLGGVLILVLFLVIGIPLLLSLFAMPLMFMGPLLFSTMGNMGNMGIGTGVLNLGALGNGIATATTTVTGRNRNGRAGIGASKNILHNLYSKTRTLDDGMRKYQ